MEISYFEKVLLYLFNKIQGERTIYSLFHLLQGKRSSQTIQDAHLYQLTPFFQSYTLIKRNELEDAVKTLVEKGMLAETAENKVILTEQGLNQLLLALETNPFPAFLNGWKYYQIAEPFWEKLTLLVQVCSNLIHNERNFIPIRNKRETLSWTKRFIKQRGENRMQLAAMLYEEMVTALEQRGVTPEYLTIRLTGFGKIGLTAFQAAEMKNVEYAQYHFEFLGALHSMLGIIMDNRVRFPILTGLIENVEPEVLLTLSTEKTLKLIQKGLSLDEIAAVRNLKQSTIEDHIVELALSSKDFTINDYVPVAKQQEILEARKRISAKKLKEIRGQVTDASYFEIRLVLAKYGDE